MMLAAMSGMKERAKTFIELLDMARFILSGDDLEPDEKSRKALLNVSRSMLERLTSRLQHASWTASDLETVVREFSEAESLGMGKVAQPVRVALTGRTVSPSVFDMMEILGREESLRRIRNCAQTIGEAA
jgi:glutamyl-tRNA synthetase